jgi:hypothetical protein
LGGAPLLVVLHRKCNRTDQLYEIK